MTNRRSTRIRAVLHTGHTIRDPRTDGRCVGSGERASGAFHGKAVCPYCGKDKTVTPAGVFAKHKGRRS